MDIQKKSLVLYKNQPALVVEAGAKYTIETGTGKNVKQTNVRDKDIILLHSGPITSLAHVYDCATKVAEKSYSGITEAWELLDGANTTFTELLELAFGTANADEAWGIWCAVLDSHLFAGTPDALIPQDAAAAQAQAEKDAAKNKEQELRGECIARLKKGTADITADARFLQEVEALALGKTDKSRVLKEAGIAETPEAAHKLLLKTGFWQLWKNPCPARFNLSLSSPGKPLDPPPEDITRTDLTTDERYIAWAIDSEESTDPDDAVGFDGEYLWIHVADPAAGIGSDSIADKEARGRGATHYLPEGTFRMLPENALDLYALGLKPVSHALSFKIKLNDDGTIDDIQILTTKVIVKRLSYKQADEQKAEPHLAPLFAIAERSIARRKKAGAVFIELPEVHVRAQDNTAIITQDIPYESGAMVREMMLLAGEAAARFAFKNNIPFQYISQDAPEIPANIPDGYAGSYRLRRCMRPRQVGVTPSAHSGLGLGMYAQVTSPLRRYGDLAAHQQLHRFLSGSELIDKDTLFEHIAAGDAAGQASVKAERQSNLHWKLVYLQQNPDWTGEAVIVELKPPKVQILIPSLAMESLMATPPNPQLNGTITVKAGNISIPDQSVTFSAV